MTLSPRYVVLNRTGRALSLTPLSLALADGDALDDCEVALARALPARGRAGRRARGSRARRGCCST